MYVVSTIFIAYDSVTIFIQGEMCYIVVFTNEIYRGFNKTAANLQINFWMHFRERKRFYGKVAVLKNRVENVSTVVYVISLALIMK